MKRPQSSAFPAGLLLFGLLAVLLPSQATAQEAQEAKIKPLKILVLGGTGFIGPCEVAAAQARGHEVTLFNRGKTRPDLFSDLEKLVGDRDPDKGEGLKALEGRKFDVVIDNSGYYPRMVGASARLLGKNVRQYIYVSSISAYADNSVEGADETAELATMEDPTLESMGPGYQYYGALKALCEQAAEDAMPGRVAVVRPGYIVGPGDTTHRFTYWPLRVRLGGDMAVPGNPTDPIQVIDARDLAEWIIHLAEENITGVFNACGPAERLTMADVLEASQAVTETEPTIHQIDDLEFLGEHPQVGFQIWAPYAGETLGFHTSSNKRAIDAGLKFRPLEETIRATLDWFDALPEEHRKAVLARIGNKEEAELLTAWEERQKG
ncbi:MAG: NAD-dependent epimerase/dehydratase family protein [Planctomycetota bacterium]